MDLRLNQLRRLNLRRLESQSIAVPELSKTIVEGSGTGDVIADCVEPVWRTLKFESKSVKACEPGVPVPEYKNVALNVGVRLGLLTFASMSYSPSAGIDKSGANKSVVQSDPPVAKSVRPELDVKGK